MKKLLFTFALMLSAMATWAQHWTVDKTNNNAQTEKVIYCKVSVNGEVQARGLELAGFIGEECRAQTLSCSNGIYALRVAGDLTTEKDADITIKVFYSGIEYTWNTTVKFDGVEDAAFPPKDINIDHVTGVKFKDVEVKASAAAYKPYELNMSEHYTLLYGDTDYTPKSQCTSNVAFKYTFTNSGQSPDIKIDSTIVKISKPASSPTTYTVSYTAGMYNTDGKMLSDMFTGRVTITATIVTKQVESITCDTTCIDRFYAYEDLHTYLEKHLTILPEDADDKSFKLSTGPKGSGESMDYPTEGGEYTVYIYPENPTDEFVEPTVSVKVYVRPSNVSTVSQQQEMDLEVNYGDDIPTAAEQLLVFTWPGQGEPEEKWQAKELTYTYTPEDIAKAGKAAKAGTGTVKVSLTNGITNLQTAVGYDAVTFNLTVKSSVVLTWNQVTTDFVKTGQASESIFGTISVSNPAGEEFSIDDIEVKFDDRYEPNSMAYAEVYSFTDPDKKGETYNIYITPKFIGNGISYGVTYQGNSIVATETESPTINISGTYNFDEAGWYWMAVNATNAQDGVPVEEVFTTDDIVEVRSQTQLLYNDKVYGYGLFGDLTDISPFEAMYKVRTSKATTANFGNYNIFQSKGYIATGVEGYNWENNPYEFDIEASDILAMMMGRNVYIPADEDVIITKSGSATYSVASNSWLPEDFVLKAGEGFIYYTTNESYYWEYTDLIPQTKSGQVKGRDAAHKHEVFTYNPHAFADNMAMIAEINGLQNPEQYTIGVFVGDECRGNGRVMKDNIFMVNAVGQTGETLTFKLYDNFSGEMFDIDDTSAYSLIKGSLSNPVLMTAPAATGISDITVNCAQDGQMYDLSGRQIDRALKKGLYIKNGKKYLMK